MPKSGEQAVHDAAKSRPVQLLARVGLLAYGVVHLLIAYLAVHIALGGSTPTGGKADKTGALQAIAATGGVWLLWLVAVGLGALVIWQLAEAAWGVRHLSGTRRLLARIVHIGEAALFVYLAYGAAKIASVGRAPSDATQKSLVARLLAEPYGKLLVAVLGIGVLVAAGVLVHRGLTKDFRRELDLSSAGAATRRTAVRLGQIGYTALGGVYGIAGGLVVIAALRSDPSKATGLDLALRTLAAQDYGVALLLVMAAGLAAFGVFALLDARYRRE
jgi:hypothetical protein